MGRRTETITISGEPGNRDNGKVFVITEMDAMTGERWAGRITELVLASGVELPKDSGEKPTEKDGAAGLAQLVSIGVPLLRALHDPDIDKATWACIKYQHAPNHPLQAIMPGEACQIEEISTVTELRMAVMRMHTGFFSPESPSNTASPSRVIPTGSSPTRTSRPRSAQ